MNIFCVDRSPFGLLDWKHRVKSIRMDDVVYGYRDPDVALSMAKSRGCDALLTEIDMGRSSGSHPGAGLLPRLDAGEIPRSASCQSGADGDIAATRLCGNHLEPVMLAGRLGMQDRDKLEKP